jgi:hypothetical protein
MRLGALLISFFVVLASGDARAQAWIEHEDRAWGFSINFPHEPITEAIEYTSFYERIVPGRTFSGTSDYADGRYVLTVVHFYNDPIDAHTAISHAAAAIRAKGRVTYDGFQELDGIAGQILSVTQEDGRLIQACVYFFGGRLYIAEGSVAAGNPAPSQFQQSISIIDPEGERIVPDDD